jgi:hypothetical protein
VDTPADPSPKATSTNADRDNQLDAEKARVLAMQAPRYAGSGDKEDAARFLDTELKPWIARRKDATEALIGKYQSRGLNDAIAPQRTDQLVDVAELRMDFCREFLGATVTAMPTAVRSAPELRRAYVGAVVDSVKPQLGQAIKAADTCLTRVPETEQTARVRCEQVRRDAARIEQTRELPGTPSSP